MAHLGEAQAVIENFELKRVTPQYFEGDKLACLITGEGPFEAATQTAAILGQKKFHQVINLGIAGAINPDLKIGSIYEIRSLYLVIEGRPQFKSFSCSKTGVDCLTSFERILSAEKAAPLIGVGEIVDREAWGVAMAAKGQGVEFVCYKLISDVAGTLGACELVREEAQIFSQKLAQFLTQKLEIKNSEQPAVEIDGLYFTFTMRHQFEGMLSKLALREDISKEDVLKTLPISNLQEEKLLPKERAQKLIQFMEERLDPLKKALQSGLEKWKRPYTSHGIQITTDPTWEDPQVKITLQVSTQNELEDKLKQLSELKLAPFINLRNGDVHVE
jgi:hypothetical protein